MRHGMRMLVKDSRLQDGIDVKDNDKGSKSRSQSMKEQAYNKEQSERPRPHELNDKNEEDSSKQGRSLIEELEIDAGISLVPPHVADQGRFDDTQVSDQPKEQLGVFNAAKVLADAAEQRRDIENVQTYTRRRRVISTGSGGVSTASRVVSTAGKVHKEEQARFNAEPEAKFKEKQEQERLDHETAMKIQEELDAAERQRMAQVHQATQGFTNDE
ncbi:hypothetical protein Tco_0502290 [Tanacetum coccineum]